MFPTTQIENLHIINYYAYLIKLKAFMLKKKEKALLFRGLIERKLYQNTIKNTLHQEQQICN